MTGIRPARMPIGIDERGRVLQQVNMINVVGWQGARVQRHHAGTATFRGAFAYAYANTSPKTNANRPVQTAIRVQADTNRATAAGKTNAGTVGQVICVICE